MIGWYVDVGWVNSTPLPSTNLSEINFTDSNRPFTFFTINSKASDYTTTDLTEFYSYMESICGNDMYSAYGWIKYWNTDGIDLTRMNLMFPSLALSFPNLDTYLKDNRVEYVVYYFKSLHKVVYDNGGSTAYIYDEYDGVLTRVGRSTASSLTGVGNGSTIMGFQAFVSGGDLSKNSDWQQFNFGTATTRGYEWIFTPFTNTNFEMSYLFSSTSKPDFDIIKPPDPYDPVPPSGPTDKPPGTFDDTSDAIPDSPLPTLSAANTGFTRIYNPSLSQVQALARYLWTDDTVIETIWNKVKQFFENPMDAIIGFNLVPVPVPNGGTTNFALMYIDTGVAMTAAANQFVDQDCGTVKLERYYGSALDQSPYTKVSCYLPYIGTVQLNTDEVMGATLQVKYRVDIVSGSCVAKVLVDGNVLYQYSGHCAITIPFASADFSNYVSAAISVAKLAVGAATAGAAGIAAAGATEASQQTSQVTTLTRTTTDTVRNPTTGRQITTGTHSVVETYEQPVGESSTKASFAGLSPANISNTVGQIMASKPNVEHSGSFSGNSGYLGVRRPFLIIERPNMCLPVDYQKLNGYPSMINLKLGECTGYTRVQQVQLTGMTATNPEQAEILSLLKSGVIL